MNYFKLIIALLIINTMSCKTKTGSMDWKIIDFNKIPRETLYNTYFNAIGKYEFNQILPINEHQFILLGDNSRDRDKNHMPKEVEAIAFVSSDDGENLKKYNLGKGFLSEAFYVGNSVYFAKNTYVNRLYSSELIKTDITLENREVVNKWKTEKISNIHFFSENIGIISFNYKNPLTQKYVLIHRYTIDGGKTWIEINNFSTKEFFDFFRFVSSNEIEFIENNKLIKLNYTTGDREIIIEKIAPNGYESGYLLENKKNNEIYTFIHNINDKNDFSIKYLNSNKIIKIPNIIKYYDLEVYGDHLHAMTKDGVYHNYIWSEDNGKVWHTEKLRDFFVVPSPITYYKEENIYCIIICFKGDEQERGGRLAIGKLK